MPRGTLWAIYAILQFINRIIVTLHFFFRSKLFYFSDIFSIFDFRIVIQKGRYSAGRNHQKLPISEPGGRGGRPSPPRLWKTNPRVCATRIQRKLFLLRSTIDPEGPGRTPLTAFLIFCEKTKFYPEMTKNAKKH